MKFENKNLLIGLLKNEIKESLLNTTAHGLPQIVRNQSIFLKIIWLILFLASSAYCSYLIVTSFKSYFEYNVITQIDTFIDIPSKFPTVT